MKSFGILLLLFFTIVSSFNAQERYLEVSNQFEKNRFLEGDRVRVRTTLGQLVNGRLYFYNDETIVVNSRRVLLKEILLIKRNPFIVSFLESLFFGYLGITFFAIAAITLILNVPGLAAVLALGGGASFYGAVISPNFFKKYENFFYEYKLHLE